MLICGWLAAMLGTALAAYLLLLYAMVFAEFFSRYEWQRIGLRIAGGFVPAVLHRTDRFDADLEYLVRAARQLDAVEGEAERQAAAQAEAQTGGQTRAQATERQAQRAGQAQLEHLAPTVLEGQIVEDAELVPKMDESPNDR